MGHTAMIAPVTPTVYRPLGPKKRTHRTNDTIWRAFAYVLIAVGVLIAAVSPIFAARESQRRLEASAQEEISRDEDVTSWTPRAARIARLVAAQEMLEQGRAPAWTQVDPWPGVFAGGAMASLGVIVLALRRPPKRS